MEIIKLLEQVFGFKKNEKVTFIYDKLERPYKDSLFRKLLIEKWHSELIKNKISSQIISYVATKTNNSDLPDICIKDDKKHSFEEIFKETDIVIALNEYSATAPLHKFSKKYNLRIASMPGFNDKMLKALDIDYSELIQKVGKIYDVLIGADYVDVKFIANNKEYDLRLDIKGMKALKDDGNCKKPGVINLPSGEAFISSLEGKNSETNGYLPIEHDGILEVFKVEKNQIVSSDINSNLMKKIKQDRAVGNIAEVAFGVLGEFKLKPCGLTLLDEKLGFHIAIGRNDHFGGKTSPESFKDKKNIWHQDYVYIKEMQPSILIKEVSIIKDNTNHIIIKNNKYIVF